MCILKGRFRIMAFCQKCGNQVPDGTTFCQVCGAPMAQQAPAQQAAPQYQPPQAPQYQPPQAPQYQPPQAPQYQPPQAPQYKPAPAVDLSDHTAEFDAQDISDNKIIAMSAYLLGVLGIVIALLAAPESKYASFHARQALKLNIASILCVVIMIVPFIGWIVGPIASLVVSVVMIICFVHVCQGKAKDAPIIGKLGFFK